MDKDQFFERVWRFNAIMIALAGVLAIGLMVFGAYQVYGELTRDRTVHQIVNVEAPKAEQWHLEHASHIAGSDYLVMPLVSDQKRDESYYSKSAKAARNYLFVDATSEAQHWLLPHNRSLFVSRETLSHDDYINPPEPVIAQLYQVVNADSNKDKRLTASDIKTLALSRPDGTGYVEVIPAMNELLGKKLTNGNQLFVLYRYKGVGYRALFDLNAFKQISQTQLPSSTGQP